MPDPDHTGVNELHALWDSVAYAFPGYPTLPFTEDKWSDYTNIATNLYKDFPPEEDKLLPGKF